MNFENAQWLEQAVAAVREKLAWVSERSADKIPYTAMNGIHDDKSDPKGGFGPDDGINWWCNGFWPGMMWQMYAETGEQRYAQIARRAEQKLDRCFEESYGLHHDVGFMWLPSAVANYRLTGDADARRRGLHAANLLAGRYNPAGNYLRAWNDAKTPADRAGWVIIDSTCRMGISSFPFHQKTTAATTLPKASLGLSTCSAPVWRQELNCPSGATWH